MTRPLDGVLFDLHGAGEAVLWAWTSPMGHNAWLALDRNQNGWIDDGTELFGSATPQPEPPEGEVRNGFLALGEFDKPENAGNADGFVDSGDAIYSRLVLWQDLNHNGLSEPEELESLESGDVARIDLYYKQKKRLDEYGNLLVYRGRVWDSQGKQEGKWAWDVFLVRGE